MNSKPKEELRRCWAHGQTDPCLRVGPATSRYLLKAWYCMLPDFVNWVWQGQHISQCKNNSEGFPLRSDWSTLGPKFTTSGQDWPCKIVCGICYEQNFVRVAGNRVLAALLISPSEQRILGVSTISCVHTSESMACGTPAILTDLCHWQLLNLCNLELAAVAYESLEEHKNFRANQYH